MIKLVYRKLRSYFRHGALIPLGKEGEISKIEEEYLELKDAVSQNKPFFSVIECADLITAVGTFSWNKFKVPFIVIILFAYIRKPYKWLRNPFLRRKYGKRKKYANEQYLGNTNAKKTN